MPDALAWAIGLIVFLVMLAISIGLHEGGHMVVAKFFKLSVPRFFVGFGPTIWSMKTPKTEYGIKAIPLGGFVLIEDETQEKDSPERNLLSHVSPWKRTLVFLAGPAVNIVLGVIILVITLMSVPVQTPITSIDTVNTCASSGDNVEPCAADGLLMAGDRVAKIDGQNVDTTADFPVLLKDKESVIVTVERDGKIQDIPVQLQDSKLGINLQMEETFRTMGQAFSTIGNVFILNVEAIIELPSHFPTVVTSIFGAERDPEAPSSLIVAGKTYGDVSSDATLTAPDKVQTLALYTGLINVGLGLINLVPILPLDGGRIAIAGMDTVKMAWSKLRRKKYYPVGFKTVSIMTAIAAAIVFSYMALLMLSDIVGISRGVL